MTNATTLRARLRAQDEAMLARLLAEAKAGQWGPEPEHDPLPRWVSPVTWGLIAVGTCVWTYALYRLCN